MGYIARVISPGLYRLCIADVNTYTLPGYQQQLRQSSEGLRLRAPASASSLPHSIATIADAGDERRMFYS